MSDSTSPQGPEHQPSVGTSAETEYLDLGRPPRRRRRRGLVAGLVVGGMAAVGLPLGGVALYGFLGGGGTQPHDVLPANAVGYVRLDLDPAGVEKIDAVRFLRSFPAFEEYTRITDDRADVREAVVEAFLRDTGCEATYADDVEPWLGERFGVALTPPTAGTAEPGVVAAIQVRDEGHARAGLRALRSCTGAQGAAGWDHLDGYLIVAETTAAAERAVEQASRSSLADVEQFRTDTERLGDPGVASMWFSGEAAHAAFGPMLIGDPGPAGAELDRLRADTLREIDRSMRSGAVAFRFDDRYVEVAAVVNGSAYAEPSGEATADLDLPASTAVALGFAGGAEYVDRHWDTVLDSMTGAVPPAPEGMLVPDTAGQRTAAMERALGLRLPADLRTLLGDTFTLALDGADLDVASVARSGDLGRVDLGVRVGADPAAFAGVVGRLERSATGHGLPFDLVVRDRAGGVVAALGAEYADELAAGGSLTDTDRFRTAVADAEEAQGVLYVDVDALQRAVLPLMGPGAQEHELRRNIDPVEAVGVSGSNHDGYSEATLRVTVAD